MIVEIGHFAMILALIVAGAQTVLPAWGARSGDARLMAFAEPAALSQLALVLIAFLALTHAYVTSDFSVANVWANSHSAKPLVYRISGVWGNHEGSMLLWVLILALFGACVALFGGNLPSSLKANVLAVQGSIAFAFLLFIAITSNPFLRLDALPADGQGLNPILQDPALAIPSAAALRGLCRLLDVVLVCRRGPARRPHRAPPGRAGSGRGRSPPGSASRPASPWAPGGPTTSSAGAAGGSGIRSRTPPSCRGSPAPRCCTPPS